MSLSPAFLDELRERTLLSALIAKTVKLQRAGREFRACCPFHNEKSPSFYVNDEKAFYHCFGCGAHGDAIRWMTDQQGLPFIDAVKELAQAANLELPAQDAREAQRAERAKSLHDVMAAAAAWFEEQYDGLTGAAAHAYVEQRGITGETRKAFGLGYAPDSKTGLRRALASFGDPMLVEAGLLIQVEDKEPYDRFRDRLMIPIRDPRGRVIAFGGRIIGTGEPKYLNSPATPLFDKGRTLYNLDRAAPAARKAGRMIVVEGYLDVIALAQAGVEEVVAPLGTALTEHQIERLWRVDDTPIICFDGDAAGQKASVKACVTALPLLVPGKSLTVAQLPSGMDPDEAIVAGGVEAFEFSLPDFLWRWEFASEPHDTPDGKAALKARLQDYAKQVSHPDLSRQYDREFRALFERAFPWKPRRPDKKTAVQPADRVAKRVHTGGIERVLIKGVVAGLLRFPDMLIRHAEALHALQLGDPLVARLIDALVDLALHEQALDTERLTTILQTSEFDALAREMLRADSLPFSFTRKDAEPDRARAELGEAIQVMVERPEVDAALAAATIRLKQSFDETTYGEQQRLLEMRVDIDRRLANLMQDDEGAD